MTRIIPTDKARQGHRGTHLLLILVIALLLTAIVWSAVEIYGESIDREVPGKVSATPAPLGRPGVARFAAA